MSTQRIIMISVAASLMSACASKADPPPAPAFYPSPPEAQVPDMPERTRITDLEAFNAYIATKPTPDELRAQYPGLAVITPDMMTTRELRGDNSRYFVELDEDGQVIGGKFQ